MKRAAIACFVSLCAVPVLAQTGASGFITYSPSGSSYNYDITLHNTGATTIDVLWYSWIPGADFMTVSPSAETAPAGWTVNIMGGGAGDGYSLQYLATTPLAAGASLSGFNFTSTETPAQLASPSPILGGIYATGQSYVYTGAPLTSAFGTLIINPVPEPITLFSLAPALLLMRRRRRAEA